MALGSGRLRGRDGSLQQDPSAEMSGHVELNVIGVGLIFLLGLRHGLDPDHIAVVDNFTFQAADDQPSLAPWAGTLFAIGHSLSVAAVALLVAAFAARFVWPEWVSAAVDWAMIALLLLVGALNLRALRRSATYAPAGWRHRLMPKALGGSSRPLAIILTGVLFGLAFDTVTQAAAWGAAATVKTGALGAAVVAATFAAGMILTDSFDSRIVAALLQHGGQVATVRRYRRAVGWIIVALSFGMAAYALLTRLKAVPELSENRFTAVGVLMVVLVVGVLAIERRHQPAASPREPA
jgi:high-affinity nickel-transport protein